MAVYSLTPVGGPESTHFIVRPVAGALIERQVLTRLRQFYVTASPRKTHRWPCDCLVQLCPDRLAGTWKDFTYTILYG